MANCNLFIVAVAFALWIQASGAEEVCCGDLGCYNSGGDFFNPIYRPLSSVPNCNLKDKLYLRLTTRANPTATQILDPYNLTSISSSHFNPKHRTVILIHGWLDKYTRPDWKQTNAELLKADDQNVIRLDWSKANWFPYFQAVSNLRLVGDYGAKFVSVIVKNFGVDPENVYLVGHSLGSHGVGYVGSSLQSKYNITVGRITGLDPAGPSFTNMPPITRLDPTDARVVDTLVTNGDVLFAMGSPQAMGELNFYPNGGIDQPGCAKGILSHLPSGNHIRSTSLPGGSTNLDPNNPFDRITELFALDHPSLVDSDVTRNLVLNIIGYTGCSHVRAIALFWGGISKTNCLLKSFQCDSYELFKQDVGCSQCNGTHRCTPMGYHANSSLADPHRVISFYTITTEHEPYCAKLKVDFKLHSEQKESVKGKVWIKLYGSTGTTEKVLLTPDAISLAPGQAYKFLPEISKDYGRVTAIGIYWESADSVLSLVNRLSGSSIHLDGNVLLTDHEGLISVYTPAKPEIKSRTEVNARYVRTYDQ